MKKLMLIAALIAGTLTTTAQDKCEYRLQSKDGSTFTGVDLPCGLKIGDKTKGGHTIVQVLPTYCHALTLKGQQCTRKSCPGTLYCKQHSTTIIHCMGITKSKVQCRNLPLTGSTFCRLHSQK